MRLDELQDIRFFLVGLFERGKCLFVIAQTEISIHKSAGWNVSSICSMFQFREKPKRIVAAAGMSISADQHAGNCRTALGKGICLLQDRDCIVGFIVGDQHESQNPQCECIVGPYRQRAASFANRLLVAM